MLGRASSMMPVRAAQRATARAATQVQCRYASGHGPSYNEPSGYLFGEKPPAPGTKRVKDAWENIWYWGMYGGVAAFAVVMYFKPDRSVRSWAAPEAEKRLDASGLPWRYKPSPNSGYPNGIP
ncbi:hypothetical protein MCAP1_000176 [Malassezia caprae]|uniref:NADH dehydrogenase [ubiquinone] 1 beta subcomplex subunit 11, mitochondrial n=1 Tax=Malassezia caprae TaxID=1381934 RepID=A0AAF0IY78_9BASI|nr:hypothetical protein MCAP1_000176 [Malassezia caprae]